MNDEVNIKTYDTIKECGSSLHIRIPKKEFRKVKKDTYYRIEIKIREVD